MASGKGRVGAYLSQNYDIERMRSSDPLRRVLDIFQIPQSRENLSALSTFLRETYGKDVLSKAMSHFLLASPKPIALFDGMRLMVDVEHFRQFDNFHLLYVDATPDIRYQRYIARNEIPGDAQMTREEFDFRDNQEPEREIESLKQIADFVFDNSTNNPEDLDRQVDECMKRVMKTA